MVTDRDQHWMEVAIGLADKAVQTNEVPVGAVIVQDDAIIASAWNQPIALSDPSAHAEVLALRQAGQVIGNYRIPRATLYVTLEPCIMCLGAIIHARIDRLVIGAKDPKMGAVLDLYPRELVSKLNHKIEYTAGVCEASCQQQLQDYFRSKRSN